jgi:hypothetical protein
MNKNNLWLYTSPADCVLTKYYLNSQHNGSGILGSMQFDMLICICTRDLEPAVRAR